MVKKGFTLIELLVVIGILGILIAVLVPGVMGAIEKARDGKCLEIVKETQTALTHLFNENGVWPPVLRQNSNTVAGLNATAAYPLAASAGMALSYDTYSERLTAGDRFGILTPWAEAVVKEKGSSCSESTPVPSVGGTIADHRLRYAVDFDGDGTIESVNVPGTVSSAKHAKTVNVRATAAVWCRGRSGKVIMSWTDGDTEGAD